MSVARLAGAGAALVFVAACLESSIVQVAVEDVVEMRVAPDTLTVAAGGTARAQALALDARGALLASLDIAWSTLDADVATVDEDGLVTGVAPGTTQVVGTVGSFTDSAMVIVQEPPVLVLSEDTVTFSAQAGGADPPPDTVDVTNGGVYPLVGLAVDSIVYADETTGWLAAALGGTTAPTGLELTATSTGLTTAGTHTATVWVSATDADDSPATVTVRLEITAGSVATFEIDDGDGQTAEVGTEVATPPSVVALDAFDNPVPGLEVSFAVTGGGGSVAGTPDTTDASGVASVDSWTLGNTAGPNSLDATLAGAGTLTFDATGVAGPATQLQVAAGDGQSAVAGAAVSTSPSVTVLDAFDNAVEGVDVVFSVTSGGGSITGSTQTTDASGMATAGTWTLGTVAGTNTVDAVASSIPDTVAFTATGLPGGIESIQLVAGDAQVDTVAATLPTQYAVKVADINDNGIPGVTVSWEVTAGGGSITATSDTDGTGVAAATRVLGTVVGTHTAQASIGGVADTVSFTATANAGTPAVISAQAGTGQSTTVATDVAQPPSVLVTDQFGNPISGHTVTFSVTGSNGSVSPGSPLATGSNGIATLTSWTLGTTAATASDTLEAVAEGVEVSPNPLVITATATAGAPATIVAQAGDGQTTLTGSAVSTPPTVRVEDQYGNTVPEVSVSFSPTAGSSVAAAADTTDATGLASTGWTLTTASSTLQNDGTFPHTLTATVDGTALNTTFGGSAIYGFNQDVNPILTSPGCSGCHSTGPSGLTFDGTTLTPQQHYDQLVGVASTCNAGVLRVSAGGGLSADQTLSLLTIYLDAGLTDPAGCGPHAGGTRTDPLLQTLHAWVRNGAPFN